jgi:hypothetical protein
MSGKDINLKFGHWSVPLIGALCGSTIPPRFDILPAQSCVRVVMKVFVPVIICACASLPAVADQVPPGQFYQIGVLPYQNGVETGRFLRKRNGVGS